MVSKINRRTSGAKVFDVVLVVILLLLMLVLLYPMYYVFIVSISDGRAVMTGSVKLWPVRPSLMAYQQIIAKADFLTSYKNTIIYTLMGTTINLLLTTLCAYPLSCRKLYGRGLIITLITFTMFFSGGLIPTYLMMNNLGLVDTRWSMVIPGAISTYNMIIMRTFFMNIPTSLNESAYLDGANDLQVLWSIILPLSKPILATMVVFYSVGHWNNYFNAVIYLNRKELFPVQILLRNIVISGEFDQLNQVAQDTSMAVVATNFKYAVIIITMLPILCVYPFAQKFFTKGVMIGSIKG